MKKAVLLLRTSKDIQETQQQLHECNQYIEEKGINVIRTLESKESAYKNSYMEREQIQEVMDMARRKEIDSVVAWKTDRIARDMDAISFFSCLMSNGVAYHSVSEGGIQGSSLIDKFMLTVRLFQGEQESENTSGRVKAKIRELNSRGIYVQGGLPYGIELVDTGIVRNQGKGTTQKELRLNEEQSEVIKNIFRLYLYENFGCTKIANWLNEQNIPTPKNGRLWRSNTVFNILTQHAYVGKLRYNTKTYENPKSKVAVKIPKSEWKYKEFPHLRIATNEEFDQVQTLLTKKKTKTESTVTASETHLFSGLLTCGYCWESIYSNSANGRKKRSDGTVHQYKKYHYNCKGKLNDKFGHEQTAYSKKKLDSILEAEILRVIDQIEFKDLSEYKMDAIAKKFRDANNRLEKIETALTEKHEEIDGLNSEIRKSILGKSNFTQQQLSVMLNDVTNEIEALTSEKSKLEELLNGYDSKINDEKTFKETITNWSQLYHKAEFNQKKALIGKIVERVILTKGNFEIKFKISVPKSGYGEHTSDNGCLDGKHTTIVKFSENIFI